MGRHTSRKKLRIRYKGDLGIKSKLVFSTNNTKLSRHAPNGAKILRVNKVSLAEDQKIGEFNPLPQMLMREFRDKRQMEVGRNA